MNNIINYSSIINNINTYIICYLYVNKNRRKQGFAFKYTG